jgi:PTS system nitrogen regulatory IIA component
MASLITPARIIPLLRARDVRHVVDETARLAAVQICLDHHRLRQAVLDRGRTSTFGFGRGVAIPHASIPGLEHPMGVFARLCPAQDFGAADEMPADLMCLLLSPGSDDSAHLRGLACVVRRLRDPEVAARLRSARSAEAIHVVLTSDAWRVLEDDSTMRDAEDPAAAPYRDLTNEAMYTRLKALC